MKQAWLDKYGIEIDPSRVELPHAWSGGGTPVSKESIERCLTEPAVICMGTDRQFWYYSEPHGAHSARLRLHVSYSEDATTGKVSGALVAAGFGDPDTDVAGKSEDRIAGLVGAARWERLERPTPPDGSLVMKTGLGIVARTYPRTDRFTHGHNLQALVGVKDSRWDNSGDGDGADLLGVGDIKALPPPPAYKGAPPQMIVAGSPFATAIGEVIVPIPVWERAVALYGRGVENEMAEYVDLALGRREGPQQWYWNECDERKGRREYSRRKNTTLICLKERVASGGWANALFYARWPGHGEVEVVVLKGEGAGPAEVYEIVLLPRQGKVFPETRDRRGMIVNWTIEDNWHEHAAKHPHIVRFFARGQYGALLECPATIAQTDQVRQQNAWANNPYSLSLGPRATASLFPEEVEPDPTNREEVREMFLLLNYYMPAQGKGVARSIQANVFSSFLSDPGWSIKDKVIGGHIWRRVQTQAQAQPQPVT